MANIIIISELLPTIKLDGKFTTILDGSIAQYIVQYDDMTSRKTITIK